MSRSRFALASLHAHVRSKNKIWYSTCIYISVNPSSVVIFWNNWHEDDCFWNRTTCINLGTDEKTFLTQQLETLIPFFSYTILSAQARIRFEMGHHYIKRGIGGHHVLFCTISKHFCTETLKKKKRNEFKFAWRHSIYIRTVKP